MLSSFAFGHWEFEGFWLQVLWATVLGPGCRAFGRRESSELFTERLLGGAARCKPVSMFSELLLAGS